ncbi:MAG: BA14K family protein [Rhizobiaceae bacterium]|nr:BA14K family protein [Rhizobiaceae bacterium]MCV0409104.1 BA14K family protein [Rhizobiaceae bacterium]
MKKILSGLCAGALMMATAISGVVPASAAPVAMPVAPQSGVINVQGTDGYGGGLQGSREWRQNRRALDRDWSDVRRHSWRDGRRHHRRGFYRDGRYGWYNGHRGYRHYRRGYREYNGFWFPLAAFAAGAVIGSAVNNPPVVRRGRYSQAHYDWCYNRYRSYRDYDNTFQPYNGPRRQCYSPYS